MVNGFINEHEAYLISINVVSIYIIEWVSTAMYSHHPPSPSNLHIHATYVPNVIHFY